MCTESSVAFLIIMIEALLPPYKALSCFLNSNNKKTPNQRELFTSGLQTVETTRQHQASLTCYMPHLGISP